MSTDLIWRTDCVSLVQSLELAASLGRNLRGGEVIELVSDVGGGKTTFVRGIAQGAGSDDHVSSPSFTLTNQYKAPAFTIEHFDFYRLSEPGILRDELAEFVHDVHTVTIVEWANIVEEVLPEERLTIMITSTGETSRRYEFRYTEAIGYLMKGLN